MLCKNIGPSAGFPRRFEQTVEPSTELDLKRMELRHYKNCGVLTPSDPTPQNETVVLNTNAHQFR